MSTRPPAVFQIRSGKPGLRAKVGKNTHPSLYRSFDVRDFCTSKDRGCVQVRQGIDPLQTLKSSLA